WKTGGEIDCSEILIYSGRSIGFGFETFGSAEEVNSVIHSLDDVTSLEIYLFCAIAADVSDEVEEDPIGGRIKWEQRKLNGDVIWDCYGKYWGITYFS
ncbi:hypothetical protein RYX36_028495, partial [Vicia faba]